MSGCAAYEVLRSDNFEKTFAQLVNRHYSTDPKSRAEFEELVIVFWAELQTAPRAIVGASPEEWPPGRQTSKGGFDFYKIRFHMPGLRGSAKMGRLMYLIHDATCTVRVLWIYTHDEFHSRPPDVDLRDELRRCSEIVISDLSNQPLTLRMPSGKQVEIKLNIEEK